MGSFSVRKSDTAISNGHPDPLLFVVCKNHHDKAVRGLSEWRQHRFVMTRFRAITMLLAALTAFGTMAQAADRTRNGGGRSRARLCMFTAGAVGRASAANSESVTKTKLVVGLSHCLFPVLPVSARDGRGSL
jgi:hypothetical protein